MEKDFVNLLDDAIFCLEGLVEVFESRLTPDEREKHDADTLAGLGRCGYSCVICDSKQVIERYYESEVAP